MPVPAGRQRLHIQARPRRVLAWLAALVTTALVTGCGFHLQGSGSLPENGRRILIVTSDAVTPFAVELRDAVARSGGEVVERSAVADTVIRIRRDVSGRRVLSVSAQNTPEEYEIYYAVEYSVDRGGREVIELQPLEVVRTMSFQGTQVLAKDREEAIIRDALARDLAALVIRRLQSL